MRVLISFLTVVSLVAAERKLPANLEPVAQLALAAPPEFAADALLKLVESKKVTKESTEIELTQQAFDLASAARFRVGMRPIPGNAADTRADSLAKAYRLNLDSVSLQSRAAVAMVQFDKTKARQMFASISGMDLPPLACEDTLVYEVSSFYRALTVIVQSGFSTKERAKEDHVAFLMQYVSQMRNAAQVAAMAEVVKSAGLSSKQEEAVVAQFNGVLENLSGDIRSFTAYNDEIAAAMSPEMMSAYHKFNEKNTNADQCKEGSAQTEAYWQTPDAQRLLAESRQLRFGSGTLKMLSDSERSKPEWQTRLTDFEKEVADWNVGAEKSEADYYHQKCIVYEALVELIPPSPERDRALEEFIAFISNSNLQGQSPVSWFMPAHAMLDRVRNTNNGEPGKVLAAFEASGNPVLSLYAIVERTFGRTTPGYAGSGSF